MTGEKIDEKAVFNSARAIDDPADRLRYLREACAADTEQISRIQILLDAFEEHQNFLEAAPTAARHDSDNDENIGKMIGSFKLLQLIGTGGMGAVYMADQTQPIKRRVALKIIKLGMDTKQVIARFEAERQALAMMDHPNIAKVLDAGATNEGRPYFVMEYIRGIPINEYCDTEKLSTKARLDLFIDVCHAIQHAHQKGVIHRDIKPSNVLVTMHDGKAVPKVIDFGIAKATNAELTTKTLFTEHRQLIGTPAYMSPEQAELSGLDIDTRSDVYSLGVLLYELLTGTTPFEEKSLRSAGIAEIMRILREEDPPKPSTRVSSMGASASRLAQLRRSDVKKLSLTMRGDLDWIVMKCLEKDRTRRYETANGLAADVQRHFANEPVVAGPPNAIYKLRKFATRNRAVIATTIIIAIALIGGTAVALWQARRASNAERIALAAAFEAETARAEAQQRLDDVNRANALLTDILETIDPTELSEDERVRSFEDVANERFTAALGKLEQESFEDPLIKADVQHRLARSLRFAKQYQRAQRLAEQAYATREAVLGSDHVDTLDTLKERAWCHYHQREFVIAAELYQKRVEGLTRTLGPAHPDTADAWRGVLWFVKYPKEFDDQRLELATSIAERLEQTLGLDHDVTVVAKRWLGSVLFHRGQSERAIEILEEVLDAQLRINGANHATTLRALESLASIYQWTGKPEEALPLNERAVEIAKEICGPDDGNLYTAMGELAETYASIGRVDEAISMAEQAVEGERGIYNASRVWNMQTLADAYEFAGRLDDAFTARAEAFDLYMARTARSDFIEQREATTLLAYCLQAGRWEDAAAIEQQTELASLNQAWPWIKAGSYLLADKRFGAFDDLCHNAISQIDPTEQRYDVEAICKLCCIRPDVIELERLPLAELAALEEADIPSWAPQLFFNTRALVALRLGDPEQTIALAKTSINAESSMDQRGRDMAKAFTESVLALAYIQQGERSAAKTQLDVAAAAINHLDEIGLGPQNDTTLAKTLFAEATENFEQMFAAREQ